MIKKLILFLLLPIFSFSQTSFISGNDTICDSYGDATITFNFSGSRPYTFIYAIDGVDQAPMTSQYDIYTLTTKKSGVYTLTSFSDVLSPGAISGSALVTIIPSPVAKIHLLDNIALDSYPVFHFVDSSDGSIAAWIWDFGDNSSVSFTKNPTHTYISEVNTYEVTLIVRDINDCMDTTSNIVHINASDAVWIPNTFTPDADNLNERFCIENPTSIYDENFSFRIYNKRGELVYQTEDISSIACSYNATGVSITGWDGKHYKTNQMLPTDNYIYEISYTYLNNGLEWQYYDLDYISLVR